jgi:CHASE3 domain sensor protein
MLEERVTEISTHLVTEEDKAKHLTKAKNRYEAMIKDLEERLKKEQAVSKSKYSSCIEL